MPQAVNVVGKAEQERLANLRGQAASGSARGEFAFDRRENAFDLGALAVRFFRKGAEHLIPNGAIRDTPAPRGNDALGSQALPNVLVVGFRVKLCIRQHHTEGSASCCHIEQPRQRTCVAPGPLTSPLRQQNLLLHIHYNQPLQPRATRPGPVGMLLQALEKEGADGSIGEPRTVDGGRNGSASASPQPTHGFLQSAIDGVVLQPSQKTIQRGVVGHRLQFQCGAQFLVLLQAYFGFAKSPVFKAHQAQHRQQLWLGELMFAEARAVGRQNLRGHLQCHASKGQESNLGHRPSCPIRKHCKPPLVDPSQRKACRGSQQSPSVANKRLTEWLSPLVATLTKKHGVPPSSQKLFSFFFPVLSSTPLGASEPLWLPLRLPSSVHSSKFRILQLLCLQLIRKHRGCGGILPISALIARPLALIARNSSELFQQHTCGGGGTLIPYFITSLLPYFVAPSSHQSRISSHQSLYHSTP